MIACLRKGGYQKQLVVKIWSSELWDNSNQSVTGSNMSNLCNDWTNGRLIWRAVQLVRRLLKAHYIKSVHSNSTKAVLALESFYKWALTGTPLQNRIGELYSFVRFLQVRPYACYFCEDCNCSGLDFSFSDSCPQCSHQPARHFLWWKKYIGKPLKSYDDEGRDAMVWLKHKILKRLFLRRTKKERAVDLALPTKTVIVRKDCLDDSECDYYKTLHHRSRAQFDRFVQNGTLMNNFGHILGMMTRLRQAADHRYLVMYSRTELASGNNEARDVDQSCTKPLTLDFTAKEDKGDSSSKPTVKGFRSSSILNKIQRDKFKTSTKIEALREEIHNMIKRDGSAKGIVFSHFTSFLDLIQYSLNRSGINCVQLDGSMTIAARDAAVNRFNEDPDCRILLMSLKAGGVALNLTVASYVFLMDPWWNPALEQQAQDRIHRIGQYKPVRIVRFVMENTIEERILELQEKKKLLFEGTVGGSSEALGKLTNEDLTSLFYYHF